MCTWRQAVQCKCRSTVGKRRGRAGGRRGRRRTRLVLLHLLWIRVEVLRGVYRSENPLLLSRTIGEGGVAFDPRQAQGARYDGQAGGLVVHHDDDNPQNMWLVNTAESTVTQWDASTGDPSSEGHIPSWSTRRRVPGRMLLDSGM